MTRPAVKSDSGQLGLALAILPPAETADTAPHRNCDIGGQHSPPLNGAASVNANSPTPHLTPGAAKAILRILLAADQSPPTVSARRDNHHDEPNP
jgi:hypothetical protein